MHSAQIMDMAAHMRKRVRAAISAAPVALVQLQAEDEGPFVRPDVPVRVEGQALALAEHVAVRLAELAQAPRGVQARPARGRVEAVRELEDELAARAGPREPHLALLAQAAHAHVAAVLARVLAPRLVAAAGEVPLEPEAAELLQPDRALPLLVGLAAAVVGGRGAVVLGAAALGEAQELADGLGSGAGEPVAAHRAPLRMRAESAPLGRTDERLDIGVHSHLFVVENFELATVAGAVDEPHPRAIGVTRVGCRRWPRARIRDPGVQSAGKKMRKSHTHRALK